MPRTVKVAVAGSGLAGLTAAWLLTRPLKKQDVRFEVHLFEKSSSLGMDASSMSLTEPGLGKEWRIDVPMRAFQGGYYPQLISLYKTLGIKIRQTDFSYSYSLFTPASPTSKRKIKTTFISNGPSGSAGWSKPSSFRSGNESDDPLLTSFPFQLWTWFLFMWSILQVILCFLMSYMYSAPFIRPSDIENKSFGEWAEEVAPRSYLARLMGFDSAWRSYVRNIMIPTWSIVCTATFDDILNYPAVEFLDFIWLTIGTPHYVVANGVRDVVSSLSKDLNPNNVHLSAPISAITIDPKATHLASITYTGPSGEQHTLHGFDHVVFATEAKTAAAILNSLASALSEKPLSPISTFKENLLKQTEALAKFQYRTTSVVNHTDDTLMPDDPRDHRELNMIYYHGQELGKVESCTDRDYSVCVTSSCTMATHTLRRPEGYPDYLPTAYQSTNTFIPPRKGTILSVAKLQRVVPTVEARKALKGFCEEKDRKWWQCPAVADSKPGPLQGAGRMGGSRTPGIWICGSFAFPGIPLLEGCVVSAKNVTVKGILECEGVELKEEPWVA